MSERGRRRLPPRRPYAPADLHRRSAEQVSEATVSVPSDLEDEDGTEDEDDGWKFVGDRGRRSVPDPVVDLRPIGTRSKFWALEEDNDSDEEIMSQSPCTPDMVQATV
jgi:hypothetical protein